MLLYLYKDSGPKPHEGGTTGSGKGGGPNGGGVESALPVETARWAAAGALLCGHAGGDQTSGAHRFASGQLAMTLY